MTSSHTVIDSTECDSPATRALRCTQWFEHGESIEPRGDVNVGDKQDVTGRRDGSEFPLAAALCSATVLECHHDGGVSVTGSQQSIPPACDSVSPEFFRCRDTFRCGWVGTGVLSRSLRPEPGEYDPREIVYDLMCPQCHSSVVYVPTCCDCHRAAADLGDERCTPCAIECERQAYETRMLAAVERARIETRATLIWILTGVSHG